MVFTSWGLGGGAGDVCLGAGWPVMTLSLKWMCVTTSDTHAHTHCHPAYQWSDSCVPADMV